MTETDSPPRPSILVIDDTPANLRVLAAILHREGHGVRIARNGRQGLESALGLPPDLILLDIMMDGMDGFEVCRELKASQVTATIPVIFVSALGELSHRMRGFEVGGVDFITKPFQAAEVIARVNLHLDLARLHRSLEERNQELERREAMLLAMSNATHDSMVMIDADDRVLFWNRAAEQLFGYSREEMLGRPFHCTLLAPDQQPKALDGLEQFRQTGSGPMIGSQRELTVQNRGGKLFPIEVSVSSFHLRGQWFAVGGIRDISKHKRAERALRELANFDELTGLCTRRHFFERGATELARCRRHHRPVAVLMLDLDHFKQINDRHGHSTGDLVLSRIGDTIRANLRRIDIAGRIGGEEFAILLPETDHSGAERTARRLLELIRDLDLSTKEGNPLRITCSIGLHAQNQASEQLESLLEGADQALYRAKGSGRDRIATGGP